MIREKYVLRSLQYLNVFLTLQLIEFALNLGRFEFDKKLSIRHYHVSNYLSNDIQI